MKLYKGERTMQMVDKDQVEACLDAGWSRTKSEPEVEEETPEVKEETPEVEEETPEVKEEEATIIRKKTGFKSIKSKKKK